MSDNAWKRPDEGSVQAGVEWKHQSFGPDTVLSVDPRIPQERLNEVTAVTAQITSALDRIFAASPLGAPEGRVTTIRWAAGASALVAEPANDPMMVLATLWGGLQATCDSLGLPVDEFLAVIRSADADS